MIHMYIYINSGTVQKLHSVDRFIYRSVIHRSELHSSACFICGSVILEILDNGFIVKYLLMQLSTLFNIINIYIFFSKLSI